MKISSPVVGEVEVSPERVITFPAGLPGFEACRQFALLLCQLVGELVVRTLDLPLPGPIVGMVLMAYAYFGPYMPEAIAFKGVSLARFMGTFYGVIGLVGLVVQLERRPRAR